MLNYDILRDLALVTLKFPKITSPFKTNYGHRIQ